MKNNLIQFEVQGSCVTVGLKNWSIENIVFKFNPIRLIWQLIQYKSAQPLLRFVSYR